MPRIPIRLYRCKATIFSIMRCHVAQVEIKGLQANMFSLNLEYGMIDKASKEV